MEYDHFVSYTRDVLNENTGLVKSPKVKIRFYLFPGSFTQKHSAFGVLFTSVIFKKKSVKDLPYETCVDIMFVTFHKVICMLAYNTTFNNIVKIDFVINKIIDMLSTCLE